MDWTKIGNFAQLFLGAGLSVYGSQTSASGYYNAADNAIAMGEFGAQTAMQGGALQADALRQSGLAAEMMADYNSKVIRANANTQIRGVTEQVRNIMSGNIAGQGATGIAASSRSFLAVANATISRAESDVQAVQNSANQQIAITQYEGQVQKTAYENQARAAEYSSKVQAATSKYQGEISASQANRQGKQIASSGISSAVSGLLRGATTLLG